MLDLKQQGGATTSITLKMKNPQREASLSKGETSAVAMEMLKFITSTVKHLGMT